MKLVVLMVCHSETIGEVFLRNRATHVICISQKRMVLDEVSIKFTHNLYKALVDGEKICNAFHKAIAITKQMIGETNKHEVVNMFKLLTKCK